MRTGDPNYDKRRGQRMTVTDAIKSYCAHVASGSELCLAFAIAMAPE